MTRNTLPPINLAGRSLLVTGAGSGIGRAFLEAALADDADCVAMVQDQEQARALVGLLPEEKVFVLDLAQTDELDAGLKNVLSALDHPVDGCLLCAGVLDLRGALETDDEQWRRVLDINLNASFAIARACGRVMRDQAQGSILFVSSQIGERGHPQAASYAASKSGINGLMRAMALELAPAGVRVNALAPGPTITPMTEIPRSDPERRAHWESRIPLGRYGEPEEIVQAARFLLSEAASYVTGQLLLVDGGLTTV